MPPHSSSSDAGDAHRREIAIFWDFESVQLPVGTDPASASKAIAESVSEHGRIIDRRLYCDKSQSRGLEALDSLGFDLMNVTPQSNDKKLLADMLFFALDTFTRKDNSKPCVVLLTNDGQGYAYTLSKLRDRGVMSIVMHGNDNSLADLLRASADIAMNFEEEVLKVKAEESTGSDTSLNNKESSGTAGGSMEDNALALCKVVLQELAKEKAEWIFGSKIGLAFKIATKDNSSSLSGEESKERYRQARALAVKSGWLEHGRRSLTGSNKGKIVVIPMDGSGNNPLLYSKEDFMRVTAEGKAALNDSEREAKLPCLFLKNVPRTIQINDLVKYLEREYKCIVISGNTEKGPPMTPYCFARIQLEDPEDAERIVSLAKSGKVRLNDRVLQMTFDKQTTRQYTGDPAFYYERKDSKPKKTTETSALGSPPRVIRSVSSNLEVGEFVLALCKTIYSCEQGSNSKWLDGGGIAAKFREALKEAGLLADENSEKPKDIFKDARADAIDKSLIQTGRRVKLADRSGDIEVVTKDSNTSRYTKELYMRLTDTGRQLAQVDVADSNISTSSCTNKRKANLNVFFKMLPANTSAGNLVHFLEKVYGCTVRRASIDSVRSKSSYCNAHVEFASPEDAAKILQQNSTKKGILYKGKTVVAVPDQRVPSQKGNDPKTFYDKSQQTPIPSTVSTVSQSFESLSITTPEASNDGQGSMGETLSVCSDVDNDKSLFCAVLYKMCPPTNPATWHATGLVGTNFQKKLKCTTEEGKERFRNSREEVITEGLVEMGRRKLESPSKDIVVAPYFSGNAVPRHLSSENYLRLTEKGVALGKEVIEWYHLNLNFAAPSKKLKTTVYISNLPRNVQVNALVGFIEQTFQLVVQRACVDPLYPAAKAASAHIEFQTEQEAKKMFELSEAQDDAGLVYAGRALRTYPDRKAPNWSKCHPKALFQRIQEESVAEDSNEDEEKKNDIAGQDDLVMDKTDLFVTKEPTSTSICDTTADLTLVPSPPKYTTPTEISEDTRTKLENLDTSDLLFGDNLTLLYAQTADYHMDDTADTEHPPVSIPFLSGGAGSMSDALVSPIRKAPDLHW